MLGFARRDSITRSTRWLPALLISGLLGTTSSAWSDLAQPGPFAPGIRQVTVTRPNGSTFTATLHYPATSAGTNAPFDASEAPCPGITFGHGFLQPVTQYASTLSHLATHGFLVIASQSEGGLFPNHANFASDLRSCLTWLETQNASPTSEFFGAVNTAAFGASGHSMGGGASILATKDDPRIKALAPTAAADTSPSSIAAMNFVSVPVRLMVGSQDTIVPPGGTAGPMYANAKGPRQLHSIVGGFHCGFTDASFAFCDSGAITRAQQLEITRRELTRFFLLHLRGEQGLWSEVWGPGGPAPAQITVTRDPKLNLSLTPSAVVVAPNASTIVAVTATNTGHAATAVSIAVEPTPGWSATPAESTTAILAPGESTTVPIEVQPGPAAASGELLLSARREIDSATRAFAWLAVELSALSADLDGNGVVNGADLAILLGAWGPCRTAPCPADLNGDGVIDGTDLAILLGEWS